MDDSGNFAKYQIKPLESIIIYYKKLRNWIYNNPVFYVSMLKLYHEDIDDPNRGVSHMAPMGVKASYDRDVEEILADLVVR